MSLVVLISGRGSNLLAMLEAGLPVSLVISNRADAAGLAHAQRLGVPTALCLPPSYPDRPSFERALGQLIDAAQPQLVALAGFMWVLGQEFVNHFAGRLVNIHPSLLPKFKGLHTHRRALLEGAREHGATVHWVSAELDSGQVIARASVPVLADDTEETLAARVLVAEHQLYPATLRRLLEEVESSSAP